MPAGVSAVLPPCILSPLSRDQCPRPWSAAARRGNFHSHFLSGPSALSSGFDISPLQFHGKPSSAKKEHQNVREHGGRCGCASADCESFGSVVAGNVGAFLVHRLDQLSHTWALLLPRFGVLVFPVSLGCESRQLVSCGSLGGVATAEPLWSSNSRSAVARLHQFTFSIRPPSLPLVKSIFFFIHFDLRTTN